MKPEIALAGRAFDGEEEYAARLCEWLEAYQAAALAHPAASELADALAARARRAYDLFAERERPRPHPASDFCGDGAYMEEVCRQREEENATLDGDFPLGNEKDMDFIYRYFSVRELALIQLGLGACIDLEKTERPVPADHIRLGFLLEQKGAWREAAKAYRQARPAAQGPVRKRISECIARAKAARGKCPACGSGDVAPLDGGGLRWEKGESLDLELCPEMRLCRACGETFREDSSIYGCVTVKYRYRYDKEGRGTVDEGEEIYDLKEGAVYPLPYIRNATLEICAVSAEGDGITAVIRAGGDRVTVSTSGEPAYAYAADEYSVCGDSVQEGLHMSVAIQKDD